MARFLYSRPDEGFMFGSVTGTVDADYDAAWLLDGLPGRPVRKATGGLALTATALSSRTVSLVAVCNHNLSTSVAISGGVTATVPAATLGADGIYLNSFTTITPVSATSLVMTTTGNPSIVGELIAGKARYLQRTLETQPEFAIADPFEWEGDAASMAPYDDGVADPRRLTGEVIVNTTGFNEIRDWYMSTRRGTRPSLIVPNDSINDAWIVTFRCTWTPVMVMDSDPHRSIHRVSFEFLELPRVRW